VYFCERLKAQSMLCNTAAMFAFNFFIFGVILLRVAGSIALQFIALLKRFK
jgi:ATP/ADP translocase